MLLPRATNECRVTYLLWLLELQTPSVKAAKEAEVAKQQQLLLQQQPLSAVQAALIEQQQQQGALSPLPDLQSLISPQASSSDHLLMPLFEVADVRLLRESLQWEFSDLVGAPGPPGMYGSDVDSDNDSDDGYNTGSDNSDDTVAPPQAVDGAESAQLTTVAAADSSKGTDVALGAGDNVQEGSSGASTEPAAADAVAKGLTMVSNADTSTLPDSPAAAAASGDKQDTVEGCDPGDDSDDSLADLLGLAAGDVKDVTVPTAGECTTGTATAAPDDIISNPEEPRGHLSQSVLHQSAVAIVEPTHDVGGSQVAQLNRSASLAQLLPPSVAAADPAAGTCHSDSSSSTGLAVQSNRAIGDKEQPALLPPPSGTVSPASVAPTLQINVEPTTATAAATAPSSMSQPAAPGNSGSRPASSSSRGSNISKVQTSGAPKHRGKAGFSFENLLDDLVVLTFLVSSAAGKECQ